MKVFSSKLSTSQVLFSAAFAATILTIFSSLANWQHEVIKFVFAFGVFMVGVIISKMIFKDVASNRNKMISNSSKSVLMGLVFTFAFLINTSK